MPTPPETCAYRGVKYRSRLEAKWAAFFHHVGWEVVYDPHADGRISFLVRESSPIFVYVKPTVVDADLVGETALVGLVPTGFGRLREEAVRAAWDKATNDLLAVA